MNHVIPENTNPSDFYLDISTIDRRSDALLEETTKRIDAFVTAYDKLNVFPAKTTEILKVPKSEHSWPSIWIGEFGVLVERNFVDTLRDKGVIGATFGQAIFLMLLVGFIFYHLELNFSGVQSRIGVLFFLVVNQTFGIFFVDPRCCHANDQCVCRTKRNHQT